MSVETGTLPLTFGWLTFRVAVGVFGLGFQSQIICVRHTCASLVDVGISKQTTKPELRSIKLADP
jgi:hypothetical protein